METAGQSPRRGDGNRHPAREWAQSIAATGPALAVAGVVSTVPSDMTETAILHPKLLMSLL